MHINKRLEHAYRLSIALAKTEFKLRNEGSYLGIFWYLLNPLLTFGLLMAIFSQRLGQDIPYYPLYLLLGIIIFNFFQQATFDAAKIIQDSRHAIRALNFPLEALVLGNVLKNFFSHSFEIFLFCLFMAYFNAPLWGILSYAPLLICFFLFIAGISFIISSLTVYFVDLGNIWFFLSRLLWFATPIFYGLAAPSKLLLFNFFNPMYYFITAAREAVIYSRIPDNSILCGMAAFSLLSFFGGWLIFHRLKNKFSELI